MANNTTNLKKDIKQEEILLTEEQYDVIRRGRTKESVNRVLRVLGLFTAILLIYDGVFDFFFEVSFIGRIFDSEAYQAMWNEDTGIWVGYIERFGIYDDTLQLGLSAFLPKLAFTLILITSTLGLIYLLTYNIIDLVNLVKGLISGAKGISRDLSLNVADGVNEIKIDNTKKSLNKKKNLFKGDDVTEQEKTAFKKAKSGESVKKNVRREDNSNLAGLTSEQLNALLLGEDIEVSDKQESSSKNLFEE